MKKHRMKQRFHATLIGVLLAGVMTGSVGTADDAGPLRPGDVLNLSNWQKAEGLLPPEVLEHYKNGEFANPIIDWPDGIQHWGADFLKGTEENRGKLAVDERGTIIDKATGRQPPYIIGFPFPDIDPADSQAAVKILWNYFYQWWYNGNTEVLTLLQWIGPTGLDRSSTQEVRYLYYDAQPRTLSPPENPNNLRLQFLAKAVQPTDVYGIAALSWRFRDGEKQDLLWSFVPALRRVRQVSSANRSDGFLGSDLSQDDGPFFDGKPEDFAWKLAAETEMYRLTDPYSVKGDVSFRQTAEGYWHGLTKDVPRSGYQQPGWKGIGWAPVSTALAKRKMWVIEAAPKDRYYLYGRIVLYIDKETFDGAWNRKFDWKGELTSIMVNQRGIKHSPNGVDFVDASPAAGMLAENVRMRRATTAGPPPGENAPFVIYRVKFAPRLFEHQELMRGTK